MTLVFGYSECSRTSFIHHVSQQLRSQKLAILSQNIQNYSHSPQMARKELFFSDRQDGSIKRSNGLLLSPLQETIAKQVQQLVTHQDVSHVLVEAPTLKDPQTMIHDLFAAEHSSRRGEDEPLTSAYYLDCIVTLIDVFEFWQNYYSEKILSDTDGDISVCELLVEQIEYSNIIVLTKCVHLPEREIARMEFFIRKLQPNIKIIRSTSDRLISNDIFHTHLFDFDAMNQSVGWTHALSKADPVPESRAYGLVSFVYRRNHPFHPERLHAWMENCSENILRCKGYLWLPTRNDHAIIVSQAGPAVQLDHAGPWYACLNEDEQRDILLENPQILESWNTKWGDRKTEIFFVIRDIAPERIHAELDHCLLTEAEMATSWSIFRDPFPEIHPDDDTEEIEDFFDPENP